MERNLLVTVSEDLDCLYGVRFLASFFRNGRDIRITLLYIAPRFETTDVREELRLREINEQLSEIYAAKGRKALEASKWILENVNFSPDRITTRLIRRRHGMVEDILQAAVEGNHQGIVLGQRGYSIFEKSLHPGLPSELAKLQMEIPLWICRRTQRGLKNVLLCIDDSPASQRITDHVACFAGAEQHHSITLFHATIGNRQNAADILAAPRERLMEQGIKKERINTVVVQSSDVAGAIKEEAYRGAYAVVAVGRRDLKGSGESEQWLMGSNTLKLIQILGTAALWISR